MQMKSLFEKHNGRYVRCGEYLIPEMGLTQEEQKPLGKYGMMRRRYLEENRQGLYTRMILNGTLMEHLQEIDETCHRRMNQMIQAMAKAEGITEVLKAQNQLLWVQRMNLLHDCAEETVMNELVYA